MSVMDLLADKIESKWEKVRGKRRSQDLYRLEPPVSLIKASFAFIDTESVSVLLPLVPEILMGWIDGSVDQREMVEYKHSDSGASIKQYKSILLCHTPTPTWDSAALLAELGRSLRIANGLSLPIKMMFAGFTWAEFNWVAQDTSCQKNLHQSVRWRKSLYDHLWASTRRNGDKLEADKDIKIWEVSDDSVVKIQFVRELSNEYSRLAKALWGEDHVSGKLSAETVEILKGSLNIKSVHSNINLYGLTIIRQSIEKHLEVIKNVMCNLKRLDADTFLYFLLQYYNQSYYSDCIKVGVMREKAFDVPFKMLSEASKAQKNHIGQASLYFSDYYFSRNEKREALTVHPYYFPSGSLYTFCNVPTDAREHCIMLDDRDDLKILKHLELMKEFDKAKFISDILSYAHWFCLNGGGNFKNRVSEWMRSHVGKDAELSWKLYAVDKDRFSKAMDGWGGIIFTPFIRSEILPYHFLPYLWSELGVTAESEVLLIKLILEETVSKFELPELIVSPA